MLINNKYIFFGTPEFAAIILEGLIKAGLTPLAVICNPDKPVGRKKIITSPPTKILAGKYKIPVLQFEKLELEIFEIQPDFAVVAAYSKIIPREILDIPKLGVVGVHPSLLPKYRGPSPIQTAILNGDETTGVTLYLMDEKVDHGPILASRELTMTNDDDYDILSRKLAETGADLLIQFFGSPTSQKIINVKEVGLPNIELQPQDESQATYTKKFTTQDAFIEPDELEKAINIGGEIAFNIYNKIRALNPEPGTWTILTAELTSLIRANGSIKTKTEKRLKILEVILTADGKLKLKKIQYEGKKPVEI